MTLQELMAWPSGMTLEEYQKHLASERRRVRRINKIADQIQECEDALFVLEDERGSERWNRWNDKLTSLRGKMEREAG